MPTHMLNIQSLNALRDQSVYLQLMHTFSTTNWPQSRMSGVRIRAKAMRPARSAMVITGAIGSFYFEHFRFG